MPPTSRAVPGRPPEALIRRLAFHGRHLPDSPADSDPWDPEQCRRRLRLGGRIDPLRFLPLLEAIRSDGQIPDLWAVPILQGVADRRLGCPAETAVNMAPGGSLAGQPSAAALSEALREWLGDGSPVWDFPRTAAELVLAALPPQHPGHPSPEPIPDLTPGLLRLAAHPDPEIPEGPADPAGGVRGRTAQAAVFIAARHGAAGNPLPALLEGLLFRLTADRHPAVVQSMVRALTELAATSSNLAWRLFRAASRPGLDRILPAAETFLQTRMADDWDRVRPVLHRTKQAEIALDAAGWAAALVLASRSGKWAGPFLAEALSTLPQPETGIAVLETILPGRGGTAAAGPDALDIPLFIALTETPAPPPPFADRLLQRFSEAAAAETVPLDALFRMAYNLLKMLDRTSGTAVRSLFFQGLEHLAKRAPQMGAVLWETVRADNSRL